MEQRPGSEIHAMLPNLSAERSAVQRGAGRLRSNVRMKLPLAPQALALIAMRMAGRVVIPLLAFTLAALAEPAGPPGHWVGTWACSSQLAEPGNRPPAPGLAGSTLREIVRVSIGGSRV